MSSVEKEIKIQCVCIVIKVVVIEELEVILDFVKQIDRVVKIVGISVGILVFIFFFLVVILIVKKSKFVKKCKDVMGNIWQEMIYMVNVMD